MVEKMHKTKGWPDPGSGYAEDAQRLLVVQSPGAQSEACLAQLRRLVGQDGRIILLTVMNDLTAALEQPGEPHVVVLHKSAEIVMIDAMLQGALPSTALASWIATLSAQLAVLRRNRRRITLVNAAALSDNRAAGFLIRLAGRLNLGVAQSTDRDETMPLMADTCPVLTALARLCLVDSAQAQGLLMELDALLLHHTDEDPAIESKGLADAAYAAHTALCEGAGKMRAENSTRLVELAEAKAPLAETRATERAGKDLDTWVAERNLLLDQLEHMHQRMGQAHADADTVRRQLEESRRELVSQRVTSSSTKREELLADEILRLGQEDDALRDQLASCDAQLAEIRNELAAVYASRSWRITGPMRKARFAVTKKANPDG